MSDPDQKLKSPMRPYVFRFAPESGNCAMQSTRPFGARPGHGRRAGFKKCWMARIWGLAPNYFKYKMFWSNLPDGLAIGLKTFHPKARDDGNVGCDFQPCLISR